jgi:hypothetical protein
MGRTGWGGKRMRRWMMRIVNDEMGEGRWGSVPAN